MVLRQGASSVLKLTWGHFDGSGFVLSQNKTGQRVYAALMPDMAAELAAMKGGKEEHIIVSETTGLPYKADHFRHEFARIRDLSGIPTTLQFRDLRRTAATEMGEAGGYRR